MITMMNLLMKHDDDDDTDDDDERMRVSLYHMRFSLI